MTYVEGEKWFNVYKYGFKNINGQLDFKQHFKKQNTNFFSCIIEVLTKS